MKILKFRSWRTVDEITYTEAIVELEDNETLSPEVSKYTGIFTNQKNPKIKKIVFFSNSYSADASIQKLLTSSSNKNDVNLERYFSYRRAEKLALYLTVSFLLVFFISFGLTFFPFPAVIMLTICVTGLGSLILTFITGGTILFLDSKTLAFNYDSADPNLKDVVFILDDPEQVKSSINSDNAHLTLKITNNATSSTNSSTMALPQVPTITSSQNQSLISKHVLRVEEFIQTEHNYLEDIKKLEPIIKKLQNPGTQNSGLLFFGNSTPHKHYQWMTCYIELAKNDLFNELYNELHGAVNEQNFGQKLELATKILTGEKYANITKNEAAVTKLGDNISNFLALDVKKLKTSKKLDEGEIKLLEAHLAKPSQRRDERVLFVNALRDDYNEFFMHHPNADHSQNEHILILNALDALQTALGFNTRSVNRQQDNNYYISETIKPVTKF